jgi:predicted O-linked N-acetylglucosamine transferase (SPINDLY family)
LIKDVALDEELNRSRTLEALNKVGISSDRIILRGRSSHAEHLSACGDIDIALDPFPQNGGITTFEMLWMGVPVIAKLGNSIASRGAAGILSAIGLNDWIAADDDDYVRLAIKYANNISTLIELRGNLRQRISASPAGNLELYTHAVETAYREMWRTYCDQQHN